MNYKRNLLATLLCGSLLCLAQSQPAFGQSYNEDEWYDPTDWFDGNNYEYDDRLDLDFGWDQYDADDEYSYDEYDPNNFGVDDYRYDEDADVDGWDYDNNYQSASDQKYGWHYEWSPSRNRWIRQYGYYDNYYDTSALGEESSREPNYGWHYEWSPAQDRWTRQYGYYDNYYDYNPVTSGSSTQRSQAQTSQPASRQSSPRVVRGEIDRVQSLNLTDRTGNRIRHQVAQIKLEDGRWVLVDLGQDRSNLKSILNEGDRIVVRGRTGRIEGRRVVMANQVQINGRNYQISRASQPGQRQQQQQQQQQQASRRSQSQQSTYITGRVQSFQPVNLGANTGRNYVRLNLQNGQNILVDLGARISSSDLNLNWNDFVTVQGRSGTTTNGLRIFRANNIWVNGEEFRISQTLAQR